MKNVKDKDQSKLWTKDLIIITLVNFLLYCSFQMFPSALPPYVKSLGAPDSVLGWITGITTIATLMIRPITGIILDKRGRKGIFFFGLIIMLASTFAYRLFPIVSIILIIRFIHGLGWGVATTASNTIASDTINKARFGEGMGYFSLSISLALAIAPALSLALHIDKVILLAFGLLIVTFILIFFVKDSLPEEIEDTGEKSSPYEKASILPAIIIFLITTTYGGIATFLALFGAERGIGNIGIFFSVYAGIMVITRPILGKMLDKHGFDPSIVLGVTFVVPGLIILSRSTGTLGIVISAALYGIGYGALQTTLQTMAVMKAPDHRVGAANATYYTGFDGGIGFGSIISGILVGKFGYANLFLVLSIFPLVGLIIYWFNRESRPA